MHKYVRMTIFSNSSSAKGSILLFPWYIPSTTDEIESHGLSLLVLSSYMFYVPILRFFNLCNALQRVNSMGRLPRYI